MGRGDMSDTNSADKLLEDNTKILNGLREEWLAADNPKTRAKWMHRIDEALDQRIEINKLRGGQR